MLIQEPPVEVVSGLWMLGTPQYPVYLFKSGHEGTLIEGGIRAIGSVLAEQFQQLGVGSDFVKQLVVTHAHPDHVMAVPLLRQMFPGVKVLASTIAAQTLAVDKAISFFCKMDDTLTENLAAAGLVAPGQAQGPLPELKIVVDQTVGDGDAIRVNGTSLTVLATPGHSDCSLSFHAPQTGILLISDATGYYLPQHDDWWPNYFGDYRTYLDSIRRLSGLGAETLCLSHNAVVQGAEAVSDYFARAMASTEQYHQRIVSEVKAGRAVRELAGELGAEVHARAPLMPLEFFQKNCALLVKKSLEHEEIAAA